MNEFLSRSLSDPARKALVEWVEAYLESLMVGTADQRAEVAKQKAIHLLADTDIDILFFVTTIAVMHGPSGLLIIEGAVGKLFPPAQAAHDIVKIMELGFKLDKQRRGNAN